MFHRIYIYSLFSMILSYPEDDSETNVRNINFRDFAFQNLETKTQNNPIKETLRRRQGKYHSSLFTQKQLSKNAIKFNVPKTDQEKADYFREMCKQNIKKTYVNLFIKKMKQLIVLKTPTNHQLLQHGEQKSENQIQPLKLNLNLEIAWNFISIFQILLIFFYTTLAFAFDEMEKASQTRIIVLTCFFIQLFEMAIKFFTKSTLTFNQGKDKEKYLKAVAQGYLRRSLPYDILVAIILMLDSIGVAMMVVRWLRILFLFKLTFIVEKVKYLEIVLIKNFYNEQYWHLIKVFLINFIFAHILSILLLNMAHFDKKNNWIKKNSLGHLPWPEKYIWGCYWSTNIMLTVGFGDVAASTTSEALCLIFIEMLSCILFTYNINSVGTILKSITSYETEKQTNIKIFMRMQDRASLSEDLKNRVTNFINQSSDMKRKYNIEEEEMLLNSLPTTLNEEYQKEVNFNMFQNIPFFRHISEKFLGELALKIQRKLAHPQEIILYYGKVPDIAIVSGGAVSFNLHRSGHPSNGRQFQKEVIGTNQKKILSLYFLINKPLIYDIKCCEYTELFLLEKEELEKILKDCPYNFQYYCMQKDKDRYYLGEFQTFQCKVCSSSRQFHTLDLCPCLHYLPLAQIVVKRNSANLSTKKKSRVNHLKSFKNLNRKKKKQSVRQSAIFNVNQFSNIAEKLKNEKNSRHSMSEEPSSSEYDMANQNKVSINDTILEQKSIDSTIKAGKQDPNQISQFLNIIEDEVEDQISINNLYNRLRKEIKEEISKVPLLLNECKVFEWEIECDSAFDFQYYFIDHNPSNLKNKNFLPRKPQPPS